MIYQLHHGLPPRGSGKTSATTHGARDTQGPRFGTGEGCGTASAKSCRSYNLRIDRLHHVKVEAAGREGKEWATSALIGLAIRSLAAPLYLPALPGEANAEPQRSTPRSPPQPDRVIDGA